MGQGAIFRLQLGPSAQSDASPSAWQCLRDEFRPILGSMQAREEISPAGRPPLAMSYASWSTFVSRSIERPRAGGVRRQYRAPGKLEVRHRAKPGLAPARVGLLYRCTSTEKARCQAVCQRGLSTPRSIGLDGPGRSAMLEFDLTKASCQITKHEVRQSLTRAATNTF